MVDRLGQLAETFHRSDLTFGLEVEANLVGSNGLILAEIYRQVNHPAMVLIFDGGNILAQGYSTAEVLEQYLAMKPGLGWIHVKDYRGGQSGSQRRTRRRGQAGPFRSGRFGRRGPRTIFRDFRQILPDLETSSPAAAFRGFSSTWSRTQGGGQFGGFSGPDGMGVALGVSAACWTTSASIITSAISTMCGQRGDFEVPCAASASLRELRKNARLPPPATHSRGTCLPRVQRNYGSTCRSLAALPSATDRSPVLRGPLIPGRSRPLSRDISDR